MTLDKCWLPFRILILSPKLFSLHSTQDCCSVNFFGPKLSADLPWPLSRPITLWQMFLFSFAAQQCNAQLSHLKQSFYYFSRLSALGVSSAGFSWDLASQTASRAAVSNPRPLGLDGCAQPSPSTWPLNVMSPAGWPNFLHGSSGIPKV